jgi:hypothetical protein
MQVGPSFPFVGSQRRQSRVGSLKQVGLEVRYDKNGKEKL